MWGKWFIRGNVACDLAGLNKVEMLPWDGWGTLAGRGETESDDGYVDIVALMLPMISAQSADVRVRSRGASPSKITSYLATGPVVVHIPELLLQPE